MVGDPSRAPRTVVIVAPFFPPSGLPPAHRARLFARHLPAHGWKPAVVTVHPDSREEPQELSLLATTRGVHVEEVRALRTSITRRFGIGDIALRALPALVGAVTRVSRESCANAILLIVPPWYLLLLAPVLSRATSLPIAVDYVDPWTMAPGGGIKRRLAALVARTLEGRCLRAVKGVFAVSEVMNARLRERFSFLAGIPMAAEPYGLEPNDYRDLIPAGAGAVRQTGSVARIVYVGVLPPLMHGPFAVVLDAIRSFRDSEPKVFAALALELYGTNYAGAAMSVPLAGEMVRSRELGAIVLEQPMRVPYVEALSLMLGAAANLVIGDTTSYYAASKLMPTLAAGRPIVAFLHEDSAPAQLLRDLNAPGLVTYGSREDNAPATRLAALRDVLRLVANGSLPDIKVDFTSDVRLQRRTAAAMTASLASLLDQVVTNHSTTRINA